MIARVHEIEEGCKFERDRFRGLDIPSLLLSVALSLRISVNTGTECDRERLRMSIRSRPHYCLVKNCNENLRVSPVRESPACNIKTGVDLAFLDLAFSPFLRLGAA